MRIFVISNFYPPHSVGGYELQCQIHVNELRKRGHEVIILTSRLGHKIPDTESGVYRKLYCAHPEHNRTGLVGKLPPSLHRWYMQLYQAIVARLNKPITRKLVEEFSPDLGFIWNMLGLGVTPILAIQEANVPTAYSLGDYWLAHFYRDITRENAAKNKYRMFLAGMKSASDLKLDTLHVISETMEAAYTEVGITSESLTMIKRGLRADAILAPDDLQPILQELPDKRVKLVYVGRLAQEKGPQVTIETLGKLIQDERFSNSTLDIIGSGPYEAAIRNRIAELNLQDRVRLLGQKTYDEVKSAYQNYDVLIFPSLRVEPLGMTAPEAMAQGVLVVATNQGGPSYLITDRQHGRLVPPGDARATADAIVWMVENPETVSTMRVDALNRVRETHDFHTVHDRIEQFLRSAQGATVPDTPESQRNTN